MVHRKSAISLCEQSLFLNALVDDDLDVCQLIVDPLLRSECSYFEHVWYFVPLDCSRLLDW